MKASLVPHVCTITPRTPFYKIRAEQWLAGAGQTQEVTWDLQGHDLPHSFLGNKSVPRVSVWRVRCAILPSHPACWEWHLRGESWGGKNCPGRRKNTSACSEFPWGFLEDQNLFLNLSGLQSFSTWGLLIFSNLLAPLGIRYHRTAPSIVAKVGWRLNNASGICAEKVRRLAEKGPQTFASQVQQFA